MTASSRTAPIIVLIVFFAVLLAAYFSLIGTIPALLLASFLPTLIWMVYLRGKDLLEPEPLGILARSFVVGMLSLIPAAVIEMVLSTSELVDTVVVAPVVEEALKPLGLYALWRHRELDDELDVLIYSVTSGLGFAFVENVFFGIASLFQRGVGVWAMAMLIRGIGSVVVHVAGVALTGTGLGRLRFFEGGSGLFFGSYVAAVSIHAAWNLSATLPLLWGILLIPVASILMIIRLVRSASSRSTRIPRADEL